ncbi:cold shock domain-containing protein [Algibacter amylolyticus]|uniref:Cold shock domain-containing protein n=1 Tax=Algibacter amylolyticus TaxID=1608400 RepID=A0A5M7AXP8_9FLAO|nr:cold shock domain-containing protein [Algibacter amylolyticus]KAA5821430.1 cold shock domain-containing protein [Algibacter amylolyticus]MBB5268304.1 CspA family cold shock protein [Algibacter amylolyticus]TSJ72942.1 cold shock domain-containing protein [Algibacter amylolyticus]
MIKDLISRLFSSKKEASLKEGTVKFFNYKKGYGFITVKDSGDEIFVHTKNLIDKIREKNKVTFTIEKSPKGPIATNVRVIK